MQTASNINFAKWSWVQSLFVMLSNQVDKLIVSTYAGLEMLSYYSIGFMVFAQLHNFFAALGAWLFPYSARLKEDLSLFKSFKNKGLNYSVALSMVMLTALSVLEMPLFEVWLGADKYIQASLFIHYFIAFESIMLITIVPYYLLNGSGFVKQNTLMEIAFKIFNIVLYTSLYFMLGTTGLMLGLIISASLYVPFQHQYSQLLLVKSSIEKQSILSFLFLFASVLIYLLQFDYYKLALGTILALFLVLNKQSLLAIFSTLKPLKA